jgi:hypothetical protein
VAMEQRSNRETVLLGLAKAGVAALALAACAGGGDAASTTPPSEATSTVPGPEHPTSPNRAAGFLQVCGTKVCLDGKPFTIHSATTYGQLDNPGNEIALAKAAHLNTLEIVEYEAGNGTLSDTMTEATWSRIDKFIAIAKKNKLHIILNLSSYGHALSEAGQKPTSTDWLPFLKFVAGRVNPYTKVAYKDEPAIGKIELLGEVDAPNYDKPTRGTTEETTAFYHRSLAQAKKLFPQQLVSSGGLSFLDDPNSGIDWRTIMADPSNDMCDVEVNSQGDRNISVPNVANFCKTAGKPWFLAAWSSCLRDHKNFDGDINSWPTDEAMAQHAKDMYAISRHKNPRAPAPGYPAVGTSVWNLGPSGECDIGPQVPLTLAAVRNSAPQSAG